jgi:hypothetical protein
LAHSHRLTDTAHGELAAAVARHFPRATMRAGPREGMSPSQQEHGDFTLAETFELWILNEIDISLPWHRMSDVARPSGRWHHQVRDKLDGTATHFARSASRRTRPGGSTLSVTAVMHSPIAAKIDAGITWIEDNESAINKGGIEDPVVRVLVIPSRYVHALWLSCGTRDRIVVVDAPSGPLHFRQLRLLELNEFHRLLLRGTPSGARPPGASGQFAVASSTPIAPAVQASASVNRDAKLIRDIRRFLIFFIMGNTIWMLFFATAAAAWPAFFSVLGICGLLSAFGLIGGTVLGVIFGVPRTLASTSAAIAWTRSLNPLPNTSGPAPFGSGTNLQPNTNLEQISDWLTKVLVGVGLTQIEHVGEATRALRDLLAPALAPLPNGGVVGVLICISFGAVGFLWGYFESRTTLMRVFADSSDAGGSIAGSSDFGALVAAPDAVSTTGAANPEPRLAATSAPSALSPTPRPE